MWWSLFNIFGICPVNPLLALNMGIESFNVKNTGSNVKDLSFKYSCQDNYYISSRAKTSVLTGMLVEQGPSQELRNATLCHDLVGLWFLFFFWPYYGVNNCIWTQCGYILALLILDKLAVSRGEEKSDHCDAKLFILPGNIWRPGLGADCFMWLHSRALATFGVDPRVSCLFLVLRLAQVRLWSMHCPALGSQGAFPKHTLQQQLWVFLTQNSLLCFRPQSWWVEKLFQEAQLCGTGAKSRWRVEI